LLVRQPASFAARQTIGTRQASQTGLCRMQRVTGASSTILVLLISTRNGRREYIEKRIGVPLPDQSQNAAAGL
jgi:hypothetical protein